MLLGSLNKPLFAWSGGNGGVTAAISGADFFDVRVDANESPTRPARTGPTTARRRTTCTPAAPALFSLAPEGAEPPPQQFQYRAAGEAPAGDDSPRRAAGRWTAVRVAWTCDAASGAYARAQDGKPHVDRRGRPDRRRRTWSSCTVDYQPSPADARSPEAQTIGTGEVIVYTGGKVGQRHVDRAPTAPTCSTLTDADGTPIELTPGHTWVELARSRRAASPLTVDAEPSLRARRRRAGSLGES